MYPETRSFARISCALVPSAFITHTFPVKCAKCAIPAGPPIRRAPPVPRRSGPSSRSIPTSTARRPVLLAVDQQLGEGATLRVAPELADPVGPIEVGEAENVEEFGASRRRESLETSPEPCLNLLVGHEGP